LTTPQPTLSQTTGAGLACAVIARATLRAHPEELAGLRNQLTLPSGVPIPAALLKHSDEQTIAALAAVLRAMSSAGLDDRACVDWTVLAAPRFLGRQALAHTLQRYAAEGAWGISPHVIPHRILHAVSGTISLALQIHGPNFGVDGIPTSSAQLLTTALATLSDGQVPGVWAVMTGWCPEPIPHHAATPAVNGQQRPALCGAVALALAPLRADWQGWELRLLPPVISHGPGKSNGQARPLFSLESFLDARTDDAPSAGAEWRLCWGGSLELRDGRARPRQ